MNIHTTMVRSMWLSVTVLGASLGAMTLSSEEAEASPTWWKCVIGDENNENYICVATYGNCAAHVAIRQSDGDFDLLCSS